MSGRKLIDLTGERFGKWLVLRFSHRGLRGVSYWLCRCDCGDEKAIRGSAMAGGKSAGCASCSNGRTTHGHTKGGRVPAEFSAWTGAIERCRCETNPKYDRYGGRGITVCNRWLGRDGFAHFLADMGNRPSAGHSLDRIDVNGNYEPGNCRWATRAEQARNTSKTRYVTCGRRTQCAMDWAEEVGVNYRVFHHLIRHGWSLRKRGRFFSLVQTAGTIRRFSH